MELRAADTGRIEVRLCGCSATGCEEESIGSLREVREVPAWRHPSGMDGQRAYEVVATSFYCAAHEQAAKAAQFLG